MDEFKHHNDRVKEKIDIWFDQDPGCDDAIALFIAAFCPQINIKGLTVTGGNVGREHCLRNAKNCFKSWGQEHIPIYHGADKPITEWYFNPNAADGWHGDRGMPFKLQEYFTKTHESTPQETGTSYLDLYKGIMSLESKVTYIITGPCTTFAILMKTFPDINEKIERVIVMGTGIELGNITDYAEFNCHCDPEAVKIVVTCPLETIVFGLEPLDFNFFRQDLIDKVKQHPSKHSWMLGIMYDQLLKSHVEYYPDVEAYPPVAYDPGVIPSQVKKDYCKIHPANLTSIVLDGEKRGKTTWEFVEKSKYNLQVATWVNKDIYRQMLFESMDNSVKE